MTWNPETYEDVQAQAWVAAGSALRGLGYRELSRGRWHNPDVDWEHWRGEVWVNLPAGFPWQLPEILIEDGPVFRPHVDRSGKVCIAPETGLLLDFTRPGQLIADALTQTKDVLAPTDAAQTAQEFQREYQAYWSTDSGGTALVSVRPGTPDGEIHAEGSAIFVIASSDQNRLARWKIAMDVKREPLPCYFVNLRSALPVPPRLRPWTLQEYLTEVELCCDAAQFTRVLEWVQEAPMPYAVVTTMPSDDSHGALCCAYVPVSKADHVKKKREKFRDGKFPSRWDFHLALKEPIRPLQTSRMDPEFLVARAGGEPTLGARSACVIGIGSVGSFFTMALARAGVGALKLVDPERLTAANIHRHVLGASALTHWKAEALAKELAAKLPNTSVEHRAQTVDAVFHTEPGLVTGSDLVACATGEETTELSIGLRLSNQLHRLHAWVEPMGLGGHVLAIPKGATAGCYRCLFDRNSRGELTNMASLAEPGQQFQRTLGGCAGTFTPFGAADAGMIASVAAHWATRLLLDRVARPTLVSWLEDRTVFSEAGFRLSRRGKNLEARRMELREDFARPDCPVCGAP